MPVRTVVLAPAAPGTDPAGWEPSARALAAAGLAVVRPELPPEDDEHPSTTAARTAHWVAHCALAVAAASPPQPLLLVTAGPVGGVLPALGFAQRAARRAVAGYVLVGPDLPRPGAATDWPDAPVTVLLAPDAPSAAADDARRRGWEVLVTDDVPAALVSVATRP